MGSCRCGGRHRRFNGCSQSVVRHSRLIPFFFFNDTATTEIYTLSLHDALPISRPVGLPRATRLRSSCRAVTGIEGALLDRKSTRLNSSHANISYAVFCLKKKKKKGNTDREGVKTHHVV